jgi:signal transduction histidine kinase
VRRSAPRPGVRWRLLLRPGLRWRILIALVATSALTLAVAAAALLPPLQDRLRTQRVDDLQAATEADSPQFDSALATSLRNTARSTETVRRNDLLLAMLQRATLLRQRTGARVVVTDAVPRRIFDTDTSTPLPARLVYGALIAGDNSRAVSGDAVSVVVQLQPAVPARVLAAHPEYGRFLLVTQRPLTDVSDAVDQVRTAFLAAAGIGLLTALVFGVALSSTLSARLARLRAAALRVASEGPDADPPRDDGRDEVGDLARTLAAMQEALRRQEAARRAFVSTASHELRTPLTSLQGTLELLQEDLADGRLDVGDAQRQVAGAQQELRRLGRLATELLDLSRLDAGGAAVALRSEPVELGELSRAVRAEFVLQGRERDVDVRAETPPGPVWAAGDPGAVARVVRILADNALRHSPAGGTVRVVPGYRGERATIEVIDEGPGVPDADRELIFERFHRGSAPASAGGFGLGLAIGRELADRMGGTLTLAPSAPGEGARFVLALRIEMPAGSHEPGADAAAARAAQPSAR